MNHDVPSDKDEPSGRMASTVDLIANYRRPSWMEGADWEAGLRVPSNSGRRVSLGGYRR